MPSIFHHRPLQKVVPTRPELTFLIIFVRRQDTRFFNVEAVGLSHLYNVSRGELPGF